MKKILALFSLAISLGCVASEPTDSAHLELGIEDGCPAAPAYCQAAPFSQRIGAGMGVWASPDCTGDFASGPVDALDGLRCMQWHQPGDTDGDVYCVDWTSPVEDIYYKDANNGGACTLYTLSEARWFVWRWCGRHPLP